MKNRFRDLNAKAKFHLEQLMEEIHHVAYNEGYEVGHEVGKQEPIKGVRPLTAIFDEMHDVPILTPNQQRAELIQKAKDFVEAMKCGEGNVFDKVGRLSRLEFYRKNNRVTCVINPWDNYSKRSIGRSTCSQGDVFNEHIGQVIAFAKAKNISIPVEFLEAVQPSEVLVGMIVRNEKEFPEAAEGPINRGEIFKVVKNDRPPTKGECQTNSGIAKSATIIDDTNAQYEIPS
ncbi:hypothetical protein [Psychrobacillus sp. FSL H8-0487]|uniref:hypothetical protein n=1 Tax=Psychrobacillus sp. FSL H8-0487 TaxID=2921391 RepID=UPI0030FBE315